MARRSKAGSGHRHRGRDRRRGTKQQGSTPPGGHEPARPVRRIGRRLLRIVAVSAAMALIALVATALWFSRDLPDPHTIASVTASPAVTLLDVRGEPFARFVGAVGELVTVDQLPPWLPAAIIATEDRRFYRHMGIDPRGIVRAAFSNLRAGGVREGGSTLTQQLAKNLFLTHQRHFKRKVQEVLLATWLEHNLSKDEILTLYLNRVYFGAGAYGVDAAARRYFGKPATEVSLAEAALLAGLLKAPSRYAPTVNPEGARSRAATVLNDMVEAGLIDDRRAAQAAAKPAALAHQSVPRRGRHFADWVRDQLPDYLGSHSATDLAVATTLDLELQAVAETVVTEMMAAARRDKGVGQVALVAMSGDGAIRAMIGGLDYGASTYNRAIAALRQPGSAFKLFVYLAALENGLSPTSRFDDAPLRIDGWQPRNHTGRYRGSVTLLDALAQSINTVAVRVSERVGRDTIVATARRLGITSALPPHPSIALGAVEVTLIELTAAYAAIANGGKGVWSHAIIEATEGGRPLYRRSGSGPGRVIDAATARQVQSLLRAVVAEGTGKAVQSISGAAGKTGTSQDYRDAWFIGYAGDLVVGVWVGNDDASPTRGVTGGGLPARIWRRFMGAAQPPPVARAPGIEPEAGTKPRDRTFWQRLSDMLAEGGSP